MLNSISNIPYIWVSLFLIACLSYDFYIAKIPNKFILFSFGISFIALGLFIPSGQWLQALQSFIIMFFIGFLLFKFKILGGGDIKALCIVALFLLPNQIQDFLIYSLMWSAAYAVIFYLLSGQVYQLLYNTLGVYKKVTIAHHKIPFTFGIILGWFSLFTVGVLSW